MPEKKAILDWIDSQAGRMRSLVERWSNINSYSHNLPGLEELSHLLKAEWKPLGEFEEIPIGHQESIDFRGTVERKPLGRALRIRQRGDAPLRVFLCIHMDTVYPPEDGFTAVTEVDSNTLRGPGVCDAKGGLAVMLTAVEAMERSPWAKKIGWEVLINPDEEIGSPGSSPLFDEAAAGNHVGLLFEPTLPDGSLVSERGGSGSYAVIVHGRSAHAGRDPHMGRNAIHAMAKTIVRLSELSSGGITINVGKVEGGGPVNVVPDLAICRLNVRAKTPADQKHVQEAISQIIHEADRQDGIHVELHGGFHRPPKPLDDGARQLQKMIELAAHELGLSVAWRYSGGVSDGNQLAAAGLPNIDSLGPRGGSIHSHEEFLLLDSLPERAKLAYLVLRSLAENGFTTKTRRHGR